MTYKTPTEHLPAEVVNEEFAILITASTQNAEERMGRTALVWNLVGFDEEGAVVDWNEWIEASDRSADQIEFSGELLQFWADILREQAASRRAEGE